MFVAVCTTLMACLAGYPDSKSSLDPAKRFLYPDPQGRLVYVPDDQGNRIPDFSMAGYAGNKIPIPSIPASIELNPREGDCTQYIQSAIDVVARQPIGMNGFRGAVVLKKGSYAVLGTLKIRANGVVLAGEGMGPDGTILKAIGKGRRPLILVQGNNDPAMDGPVFGVATAYVPIGAMEMDVALGHSLKAGDFIRIRQKSSDGWIKSLGMDFAHAGEATSYLRWIPGKMDLVWERTVVKVDGQKILLDAPITSPLDSRITQATVMRVEGDSRIHQVGVENFRCESVVDSQNPKDEEHSWVAIAMDQVQNGWVRDVCAIGFCGSAVRLNMGSRQVTVQDCEFLAPVSEIAGERRHAFFTQGQLCLFQRLRSEQARHDFTVGHLACGPNVFLDCISHDSLDFSGPAGSWASGVLFDNIKMDGGGLSLTNREIWGQGVGWAGVNSVLWQCSAPVITNRRPPGNQNWAIGCWAQFVGDGNWKSLNEFVKPASLFRQQLVDRIGPKGDLVLDRQKIVRSLALIPNWIEKIPPARTAPPPQKKLELLNGWLAMNGTLVSGRKTGVTWWRGSTIPSRVSEFGGGVTRYVPGIDGPGYTDDLDQLTDQMVADKVLALEHHWGLWYDRRRDDHEMVRRMDGEVWAPFYEQPFARSGQGKAWDGLSKYDLTRYNDWYFSRLREFAGLCEQKGLVLVHQAYFQHNILEAGAHWADFPFRSANCIQPTGFPEPPPYVNNKRIFMADDFYDVTHPVRRQIHTQYIRKCLNTLAGCPNVLFQVGEEYTGPLHFVQFWLDTIAEWEKENGIRVKVCLSCTKDVQDAILEDDKRSKLVSVVDMKYWWYNANGGLYAPKGGANLSPRQHYREWKGNKTQSESMVARQVWEYRCKYPDKAVISSLDKTPGLLMVFAGGSASHGLSGISDSLQKLILNCKPDAGLSNPDQGIYVLLKGENGLLVYAQGAGEVRLKPGDWHVEKVFPGQRDDAVPIKSVSGTFKIEGPSNGARVFWIFQ